MFFIMNKERAIFFIDGGYLSFISKFLGKGKHLKFKIEKFAENICERNGLKCKEIYFYTAPPYQSPKPTPDENKRKANYDKFVEILRGIKSPAIYVREGRCQKIKNDFFQKGIDTLITMDLLKSSQGKEIKNIVVLTADTDFVPIIKEMGDDKKYENARDGYWQCD